jgi:hypothetical protein
MKKPERVSELDIRTVDLKMTLRQAHALTAFVIFHIGDAECSVAVIEAVDALQDGLIRSAGRALLEQSLEGRQN